MKFADALLRFPRCSVTATSPLWRASGTSASTRLDPSATIGASLLLNQMLHSEGWLVSNPAHEITISPPAIPAVGSMFKISNLDPIFLEDSWAIAVFRAQ